MTKLELETYKKDYFIDPNLPKIGMPMYAIRTALLKAVCELKKKISGEVLDIGCGVMPYKEFLESNNKITKYRGIDLPPTQYHHDIVPDIYWDGLIIPLPDNSVDWVIATEFFEHYFEIENILKEIKRVLKNDGQLFFTVPFVWPLHEVPFDEYRYTPFSLEKLFLKCKYSDILIKPLGGFNRSMATMIGLWIELAGIRNKRKKLLKTILLPFFLHLIKTDAASDTFKNNQMPSGLFGFVSVKK